MTAVPMLAKSVSGAHAWNAESIAKVNVLGRFSDKAMKEILAIAEKIEGLADEDFDVKNFSVDALRKEVESARDTHIDKGRGFVIFEGFPKSFTYIQARAGILAVSQLLGEMIAQKQNGELLREVKYRPEVEKKAQRYSDKKEGGDYHTDGAEIPPPLPKYLPLLCIRPAKEGGKFLVISSYEIHNRLLKENPQALERLYKPFMWDMRDGKNTFEKPVFSYDGNSLTCTYLRSYINVGYQTAGKQMTDEDTAALDAMDKIIEDLSMHFGVIMQSGQLMVSNNYTTIHGRTAFNDYDDEAKARLLLRTWVCEKGAVPHGYNPYKK